MEYLLAIIVFICFISMIAFFIKVMYLVKKQKQKLEEMVSNLSEEQKNKLSLTDVKFINGKKNEWIQDGMIAEMNDKGAQYSIKVLYYNKVIPNSNYNNIEYGETTLSKKDVEKHKIQEGDFVKIYIAPKTTGELKLFKKFIIILE